MRSRRVWGAAVTAAVTGLTGGLVVVAAYGGQPGVAGDVDRVERVAAPVPSQLRTAAVTADGAGNASLSRRATRPFSLLGVTWTNPRAKVRAEVEIRVRVAGSGAWSEWQRLETDTDSREDDPIAGARGGTEPLWVGRSDGVQVRVTGPSAGKTGAATGGAGTLPRGLRLEMIDPGEEPAGDGDVELEPAAFVVDDPVPTEPTTPAPTGSETPTAAPTETPTPSTEPTETVAPTPTISDTPTATPSQTPTPTASPSPTTTIPPAPPSTVPRPPITRRSGWSADESISPEEPIYLPDGIVRAVTVHHTAGTNTYACSESGKIIRGIYAYDVLSRGYRDIGYNFLVNKCGTIYEGRKGGFDRPVYGAHARGWNSQTSGVAVLGDFNTATLTTETLTSLARFTAWKLGQYNAWPAGNVSLTAGDDNLVNYNHQTFVNGDSYVFPRIFGHRDGNATECPGTNLYAKLGTLRTWAAGPPQGLAVTSVDGATASGSTYYTDGGLTVGWRTTSPAVLLSKFELLVDGTPVATASKYATSAEISVPTGSHQVQVRATHQSGRTTTTGALTVVADTTPPTFTTTPSLSLRTGTINTTAVPVKLAWKAADDTKLHQVALTAPTAKTYSPSSTAANLTANSGSATTWTLKATDYAGNSGTASLSRTPVITQETAAARYGTWTTKTSSSYLGGRSYTSSSKNASLTWKFTGRSVAWIVSRATNSGQAHIYIDGVKTTTVDLRSSTTRYRDAIWTRTWPTSGSHTIKIVVAGTTSRPAITTDGIVYLK